MKQCSLNEFLAELRPWLDGDHIHEARVDERGRLVLFFLDGTKNVYEIDDCSRDQVRVALAGLEKKGIKVTI